MAFLVVTTRLFVLFFCFYLCVSQDISPVVQISNGQILGSEMNSSMGKPFYAFKGIPYGYISERFTAPQPAKSWSGVLDAVNDTPSCMQFDFIFNFGFFGEEECLNLNVFTPNCSGNTSNQPLPVMVYISGGSFQMSTANSQFYGPEFLMNNDIVLVVINYRVGPFGFLSTGDSSMSGNYGLLDQVMALQWVQENIAAFGGDKTRVTIFGDEAGGASAIYHLLSPASAALFHGIIAQGGSPLCPFTLQQNPLDVSAALGQRLGCPLGNTATLTECLRQVPPLILLKAYVNMALNVPRHLALPVVEDSKTGLFLTQQPYALLKSGQIQKVPVIIGFDADEGAFVYSIAQPLFNVTEQTFEDQMLPLLLAVMTDFPYNDTGLLEGIDKQYFQNVQFNNSVEVNEAGVELLSDVLVNACSELTINLLTQSSPAVYFYIFDYSSDNMTTTNFSGQPDISSSSEVLYLFNISLFGEIDYTQEDFQFIQEFTTMWTNFAASGNPTPNGDVQWTPTTSGANSYLNITCTPSMSDNFATQRMQFWNNQLVELFENQTMG